ncbi:hypothetical protein B0H12DRAFT_1080065 [Mycena haematopus]|nr:hypothetical protein B0H12DRAFT_1080065 [Mycena haematopus]
MVSIRCPSVEALSDDEDDSLYSADEADELYVEFCLNCGVCPVCGSDTEPKDPPAAPKAPNAQVHPYALVPPSVPMVIFIIFSYWQGGLLIPYLIVLSACYMLIASPTIPYSVPLMVFIVVGFFQGGWWHLVIPYLIAIATANLIRKIASRMPLIQNGIQGHRTYIMDNSSFVHPSQDFSARSADEFSSIVFLPFLRPHRSPDFVARSADELSSSAVVSLALTLAR